MDIISSDTKGNKNVTNGVQILKKIISLNHRPITILVPNEQIKRESTASTCSPSQKIPRPSNAFMIFANENRKKVAKEFPQESNKEISCRLGAQWKNLSSKEKEKYFSMAKILDADHKRKYPDYVYNPKEARIRKAMRERERSLGAAQMGSARSRRPNWPKQAVHMPGPPGPTASAIPEHLLGPPSKELCSALRAEMEHGFLSTNGSYVYPSHQYQFSPQADYATYIQVAPATSNWVSNGYNIPGNAMVQQQIWNQYQTERLRAQQTPGPAYLMNHQAQPQDYHMPSTNMMQMGPTSKPTIQQNIENAANDVDRYINMSSSLSSNSTTSTIEVRSPISEPLQPLDNSNPRATTPRIANSTPTVDACASTETTATDTKNKNAADGINDIVSGMQENNNSTELNISNVTAMSEVDAQINNMDTNTSNSDSNFGGITLFDESNIPGMNSTDLHKAVNAARKTKLLKPETIPVAHSSYRKPEIGEPYLQSFFPIDIIQGNPPFMPPNNYFMEHFISDIPNSYSEVPNIPTSKSEFPVDFSAQKYYESVVSGNFDGPVISGEHFGSYICDDSYSFLAFSNSQEMSNPCTYTSNQFEVAQFLNDPNETKADGNENNVILDLSKMAQSEEQIDIGEEKDTSEKLIEVSNKICDELAKLI